MCKSSDRFSKDVLIARASFVVISNSVIYYIIVDNQMCCKWKIKPYSEVYDLCSQMVVLMCFGEIPVPIPNTEVKPNSVDDTGYIVAGKVDWCHHL